jgi:hypothetical protein
VPLLQPMVATLELVCGVNGKTDAKFDRYPASPVSDRAVALN